MEAVELFEQSAAPLVEEALAIRLRVFVEEQGVPLDLEIDEHDRAATGAVFALIRSGAEAVATGRFYPLDPERVQIGRMAVLPGHRGRGLGRALLAALTAEARRRGFRRAELHAQTHAAGFYRRAGYREFGEPFDDAGIAHIAMAARL